MSEIRNKITELRIVLREAAAEGDTTKCDEIHGMIGTLEEALSIVTEEHDFYSRFQDSDDYILDL